jgi:hypothetical protein
MVDNASKRSNIDENADCRVLKGTSVVSVMKKDASAFHMLNATQNLIDGVNTSSCHDEESVLNLNYQMLLVMHADSKLKPSRPVLRVVSLSFPPNTVLTSSTSSREGNKIITTCQLGDSYLEKVHHIEIDNRKIHSVYLLSLTDAEATLMINKISEFNTSFCKNNTVFSERSNIAVLPIAFHKTVLVGARSIIDMSKSSHATDVQIAIIVMMECIQKSRSLAVRINRLHPYLATPENLQDTVSVCMRRLDIAMFNIGIMKFTN